MRSLEHVMIRTFAVQCAVVERSDVPIPAILMYQHPAIRCIDSDESDVPILSVRHRRRGAELVGSDVAVGGSGPGVCRAIRRGPISPVLVGGC